MKATRTCTVADCDRPHRARGLCATHYKRLTTGLLPLDAPVTTPGAPWEERFRAKVHQTETCWLWTGNTATTGYGVLHIGGRSGRMEFAHRLAYELLVGPIPDGLHIDHLCHNVDPECKGGASCRHRRCVNPAHLEPVTQAVNIKRGRGGEVSARKTHCPHGHPYSPENTYRNPKGSRVCLTCKRDNAAIWRASRNG